MTAALRARLEAIRADIADWQDDDDEGYDTALALLAEARNVIEDVLATLPALPPARAAGE